MQSHSEAKPGDKIRVSFEAEVMDHRGERMGSTQRVRDEHGWYHDVFTRSPGVEVTEPSESHYTPGIYRDAEGHIYRRTWAGGRNGESAWYRMPTSPLGDSGYVAHDVPKRPLVKLTPESK